jgi:arylsulfatase A-like enzyme
VGDSRGFKSRGVSLGLALATSLCAGFLLGALDGVLTTPSASENRFLNAVVSAPFGVLNAVFAGALIWVGVSSLNRLTREARSIASQEQKIAADLRAQALGLAIGVGVVFNAMVLAVLFRKVDELTDRTLVRAVLVMSLAASSAVVLFAFRPLLRCLIRALTWLAGKGLALPRSPALRYGLFVLMPVTSLVMAAMRAAPDTLPPLVGELAAPLLNVVLSVFFLLATRNLRSTTRRALSLAVFFVAPALLALTVWRVKEPPSVFREGFIVRQGVKIVQIVSDFDRDGDSALLGGSDCAPFDAKRGPQAKEIRGNGVDEDCDGQDLKAAQSSSATKRYSGALSRRMSRHYNVIWIVVDAMRADHMSQFGYANSTTPALDALARESLNFAQAFSQSSATCYSMQSMFVGMNPASMSWTFDRVHQASVEHPTLATRLAAFGYRTAAVVNTDLRNRFHGISRGHEIVVDAEASLPSIGGANDGQPKNLAPRVFRAATDLLARFEAESPDAPFLLTLYMPDPHAPYMPHGIVRLDNFIEGPLGRYDSEIAYTDMHIGVLLEQLRQRQPNKWKDTVVVVTADHGEEFGEHGGTHHGHTCHIESLHVPLIVRVPGLTAKRVDSPVALIDVVPTLLELLGEESDDSSLQGQSLLVPALATERLESERPVFCGLVSYKGDPRRILATRSGGYTFIRDFIANQEWLFDHKADPLEQHNLLETGGPEYRAKADVLRAQLTATDTGNLQDYTHF